jgi:hypothetical protein
MKLRNWRTCVIMYDGEDNLRRSLASSACHSTIFKLLPTLA